MNKKTLPFIYLFIILILSACKEDKEEFVNVWSNKKILFSAAPGTSISHKLTFKASEALSNFDASKEEIKQIRVNNAEIKASKLDIGTVIGQITLSCEGIESYTSSSHSATQVQGQVSYIAKENDEKLIQFIQEVFNKALISDSVDVFIKGYNVSETTSIQNAEMSFAINMDIRLENK